MKVTPVDLDLSNWYPGTRVYRCEDGRHIAVHADIHLGGEIIQTRHGKPAVKWGTTYIVLTPTVIVLCDERGWAEHLTPEWSFDPGTSVEDALSQAGFELS